MARDSEFESTENSVIRKRETLRPFDQNAGAVFA